MKEDPPLDQLVPVTPIIFNSSKTDSMKCDSILRNSYLSLLNLIQARRDMIELLVLQLRNFEFINKKTEIMKRLNQAILFLKFSILEITQTSIPKAKHPPMNKAAKYSLIFISLDY